MMNKKGQLKIQVLKNHRFFVPQSSKAQLKIQEMAFMLMAVLIFFVLAGLFFVVIQSGQLNREATNLNQQKAMSVIANIANSPELNCGKPLCIDSDKLLVLQGLESYESLWQLSSLSVLKMSTGEIIPCTLQNYPNCNFFEVYDKDINENPVSTFVSLCRKERTQQGFEYNQCEMAEIIGGFEIKGNAQ